MTKSKIIGIDPGNEHSGICMISENSVLHASIQKNIDVFGWCRMLVGKFTDDGGAIFCIEDLQPFMMRLTPQVIDTAKFIGELTYRLNITNFVSELHLVPRNSIKKWIFDIAPDIVLPRVNKKMLALDKRKVAKGGKGLRKNDGQMRLPSFHYVDDRVIIAALKSIFNIPTPKPGKPNIFGLHSHSWQACAVAGYQLLK